MTQATTSHVIEVPKWLRELHGTRSTRRDLVLVQGCAWGVTALVAALAFAEGLPLWAVALLALLVVDIAGGVVSNVTPGTNAHYNRSRRARVVFLALHVLQPAALVWLFPGWAVPVAGIAVLTLVTAFGIEAQGRRAAAAPVAVSAAVGLVALIMLAPAAFGTAPFLGLPLILVLYVLKVAVAFPVDWHPTHGHGG
ncbi:hypothetical protein [Salinarimonas chemoclinalis]|uniref:hypothetical protein n=1 Tax=Salinarimonas chemoclinalis TaxID=3241599 RepID=UPI00355791C8